MKKQMEESAATGAAAGRGRGGRFSARRKREPVLGAAHLSKSAVSRVVSRLKALFATWQTRDLTTERYAILFLDGFYLKVRLARRVVAVPVLAVLGITETGDKRLVALRLGGL